jgi:hypothetical protein
MPSFIPTPDLSNTDLLPSVDARPDPHSHFMPQAPGTIRRPDSAFEVHPHFELDVALPPMGLLEAVTDGDEARIWSLYRNTPNPDRFYDWLDAFASHLTFERPHPTDPPRGLRSHASLFMLPVLFAPNCANKPASQPTYEDAGVEVQRCIQTWFGTAGRVHLFVAPMGYEHICTWSPTQMQHMLQHLVQPTGVRLPALPERVAALCLPPEAPTLAFFVGALERPLARPEIPLRSALEDAQLRQHVAARLALCGTSSQPAPWVGVPACFAQAAKEGLDHWLQALDAGVGLRSWDVLPVHEDQALCQLAWNDAAQPRSWLPIRGFHMGPYGHAAPLHALEHLAHRSSLMDGARPL